MPGKRQKLIFIISGPGGVGKGTLARAIVKVVPDLWLSRSYTSRSIRPGEAEDAYYFVDKATFERLIEQGTFLEWAVFNGNYYGTPLPPKDVDSDILLEIDLQGAKQIISKFPKESFLIFVLPKSEADLAARMAKRGDKTEQIETRLRIAKEEIEEGKQIADFIVVNDSLEKCIDETRKIIEFVRNQKS